MAVDKKIPQSRPGVAEFSSETWGNSQEPRFGDMEAITTEITVTATGADITHDLYAVIAEDGTAATHDGTDSTAAYITAQPVSISDGQTMTFAVYRTGHWNQRALVWDASFDTDEKKQKAFEGGISPALFVSKPKFSDDALYP